MHPPGGINLIVIMVVLLMFLGPEKLPELARSLGKAMNEFKRSVRDVTDGFDLHGDHGYHSGSTETRIRQGNEQALAEPSAYNQYHPESQYGSAASHSVDSDQTGQEAGKSSPSLLIG